MDYASILEENSILESDRLILRPFTIQDVPDVYLFARDEVVTRYLTWPPHKDMSVTEKMVREIHEQKRHICNYLIREQVHWIVIYVWFLNTKSNFWILSQRDYWNRGCATENWHLYSNLLAN